MTGREAGFFFAGGEAEVEQYICLAGLREMEEEAVVAAFRIWERT